MGDFYTAGDAAKETGLSTMGIKAASARGELHVAAKTRGGIRLFRAEDIQRFKREREQRASK